MRKFIWPMLGLSSILIVVVGFFTGMVSITPQKREIAVPLSPVAFKGDSEMKLDEMLDLIAGLSNQIVGLKEREAKGAVVVEEVKRLQSEIAKLRAAIDTLTALSEKKEPSPPPPTDTKNEELETKVKALERKVRRLSKPKLEEPKASPAPSPTIEWKAAPAMLPPPLPIVTAMEVYSPPCHCTTTHHQLVHRRSGIFGLGILGRRQ